MLNTTMKRLEALEQRRKKVSVSGGLDAFYSLSAADMERQMGRMYNQPECSKEEAERVYKEIMG